MPARKRAAASAPRAKIIRLSARCDRISRSSGPRNITSWSPATVPPRSEARPLCRARTGCPGARTLSPRLRRASARCPTARRPSCGGGSRRSRCPSRGRARWRRARRDRASRAIPSEVLAARSTAIVLGRVGDPLDRAGRRGRWCRSGSGHRRTTARSRLAWSAAGAEKSTSTSPWSWSSAKPVIVGDCGRRSPGPCGHRARRG